MKFYQIASVVQHAGLTDEEANDLCSWLKTVLGTKVREVRTTNRLNDSPAIVTDHESGTLRKMMRMLDQANAGQGKSAPMPPQIFEINPNHPLIVSIFKAKGAEGDAVTVAKLVTDQLFDNALIAAGLVDDPRSMLPRLNEILKNTLK